MDETKRGKRYPRDFKESAVARVRDGESVVKVSGDIGVAYGTLASWCRANGVSYRQYERRKGVMGSVTTRIKAYSGELSVVLYVPGEANVVEWNIVRQEPFVAVDSSGSRVVVNPAMCAFIEIGESSRADS